MYDWVSFTIKCADPYYPIWLLGLDDCPWQDIKGAHGYQDRKYFNCISIHYNGRPEMGVWVEMSGQGCRAFESFGNGDYENLFKFIVANKDKCNLTRLDIAFDDRCGLLDIERLTADTLAKNYVSRATAWEIVQSLKGTSIVIGSPQSDVLIRIYDKAAERQLTDGSHWIRIELQLRRERCYEFVKLPYSIGEAWCGVILNYLRYVEPDGDDTNKWRWPLTDYWAEMIGAAAKLSIYEKPGVEYNLSNCEHYVFEQAGNAINALLQIYDVDTFLQKLKKRKARRNPKYEQMVDVYHGWEAI